MRAAASSHFDVWTRRADVPSVQSAPKRLTMHEIKKAEKNSSRPEPDKTYHITGKKTTTSPWQQADTLPPGSVTRERVRKRSCCFYHSEIPDFPLNSSPERTERPERVQSILRDMLASASFSEFSWPAQLLGSCFSMCTWAMLSSPSSFHQRQNK